MEECSIYDILLVMAKADMYLKEPFWLNYYKEKLITLIDKDLQERYNG